MPPQNIQNRASVSSACLEAIWQELRKEVPRLPAAVIVLLDIEGRRIKRGHFAPHCWDRVSGEGKAHEIAVSPRLFSQPDRLLATLMHEAAHALLLSDNGGCSGRYYHKIKFRDKCHELGLHCTFRNTRYGWTNTCWPASGVPNRYEQLLKTLRATLPLGATGQKTTFRPMERKLPPSGRVRLTCQCLEKKRSIYAPISVAKKGLIRCGYCQCDFSPSRATD